MGNFARRAMQSRQDEPGRHEMSDMTAPAAHPAKGRDSALQQILKSLLIVGVCGIFLRFGSLIVTVAVSHLWEPENPVVSAWAFLFRQLIMVFIYPSVLNLFRPAFIPLYNEIKTKEGPEAAMVFARGVLEIGIFLALMVFGVIWFWPELTVTVMAPAFSAEQHAASVALMRQMAPGILFLLVAEMYLILFHAEKRFAFPHGAEALQKIAWGVGIVVGAKLLGGKESVIGTAYSAGCLLQVLVTAYGMQRTFGWVFRYASLRAWMSRWGRRAGWLVLPLIVGIVGALARDYLTHWLQTALDKVAYVSVEWARQLTNLPKAFLGQIISMVLLPHLASILHSHGVETHRRTVEGAIETLWLLSIPVTAAMLVLAPEMMALLFIKGHWSESHYALCDQGALAVRMIALGFTFVVLESVLLPGLFSIQSMWWPTLWGVAAAGFQILCLAALAMADLPKDSAILLAGVAVVYPLSRVFKNGILLLVLRRKTGLFPGAVFPLFVAKMVGLLLACTALTYVARKACYPFLGGIPVNASAAVYKLKLALQIGVPCGVMCVGFLVLTWFGGYREQMLDLIRLARAGRKGRAQVDVPEA
jgi:peptidoglycan biosynthesis protein MviN/MurJ (putative lipid II flippase)